MTPHISVIIPAYHAHETIARAVASIRNAGVPMPHEVKWERRHAADGNLTGVCGELGAGRPKDDLPGLSP